LKKEDFAGAYEAWLNGLHPEDAESSNRESEAARRGLKRYDTEFRIIRPDGSVRNIKALGTVLRDADGNPVRMIGLNYDITREKEAEENLRDSERRYRSLFDAMSEGFCLHEIIRDGNGAPCDYLIVDANPAFEKIIGIRREDAVGRRATAVYSVPEPPYLDIYAKVADTGQPAQFETEFKPMQKAFRIAVFSPARGMFATIFADITEMKKNEFRYRLFRDRLNYAFQAAHIGAWELDLTDHTAWRSLRHDEIFGYKTLLPLWTFDMFIGHVLPEDRDPVNEKYERALATRTDWDFECRIKRVDGQVRWIWAKGNPKYDEDNKPLKMFGIVQDITERKKAEEDLRQSQEHFRSIVADTDAGYFFIDKDGIIRDVNKAWVRLYGYDSADEVLNRHFVDIQKVEDIESAGIFVRGIMAGDPGYTNGEFSRKCRDGSVGYHYFCARPVTVSGEVTGIEGFIVDSTARKKAEERLKASEEALTNTQKLESLGILAGGIAHDFNNLLGGIYGYIDLASEIVKDQKLSLYLSRAMQTIDRGRDLTRQLLTFSKGGNPILALGRLDAFIRETTLFALSGSNISCKFDIPPDLWSCHFDKNQIGQVIDNIVINAKQAMPGGGTIEVSAANLTFNGKEHPYLEAGQYVDISIRDHGIGMPREILPRIFDPFYTTKTTGHGLGLATCYSIIKRHSGAIEVESEPGKGSTFRILLPATVGEFPPSRGEPAGDFRGSGTFLVMDDEEVIREVTRDMLRSAGYNVVCVENGRDAIAFIGEETNAGRAIAGALFDLTVPGSMGGKEAVAEVRKLGIETPVFAVSGHAEDPIIASPAEFGFTASICKPFRKSDLLAMLGKYMKKNDNSH
jgi:PAS domain S-box-containing protein